jgi:hypothetical protein
LNLLLRAAKSNKSDQSFQSGAQGLHMVPAKTVSLELAYMVLAISRKSEQRLHEPNFSGEHQPQEFVSRHRLRSFGHPRLLYVQLANLAALLIINWIVGSLGVGLGLHRLLTHRSFKVPRWLGYLLTVLGTMSRCSRDIVESGLFCQCRLVHMIAFPYCLFAQIGVALEYIEPSSLLTQTPRNAPYLLIHTASLTNAGRIHICRI